MINIEKLKFYFILCATLLTGVTHAQIQIGSDIDGVAAGDNFGHSIALSNDGNRMAIGAPQYDGTGIINGYVRFYDWNGSAWMQLGAELDGEAPGDKFGLSVALSADGNRVAIGAPSAFGSASSSGHVRIYDWNGSSWVQVGPNINGEASADFFGFAVSLSSDGNRVAISAPYNDGAGTSAGHIRIYDWDGSVWVQVGSDIDGDAANDQFGTSVALSSNGNRVAAGATLNSGIPSGAGYVGIYDWNGVAWVQVGTNINGEVTGDLFGRSVALSADGIRVAIGGSYNDGSATNAGHVQLYDWNGSAWVQVGSDIDGEAEADFSGRSLALSATGDRVAICAPWNDGAGEKSGHVRLYDWNGSTWVQVGSDIDGEAAGDESGSAVALSASGERIAIGAINNDGSGTDAGHVRVYSYCTPAICDDGDPCTTDICDPVLGCIHSPLPDEDGDGICDAQDSCPVLSGEIGDSCDDGLSCTENDEITASCECHGSPNNALCDDGLFCNGVETCDPTIGCIAGTPVDCNDGITCTIDSCDEGSNACVNTPNDSACDDGDPCTVDSCSPIDGCVHTYICGPPNDICSGAIGIPLPTFLDAWNEYGTLSGATSSGVSNCDPQVDPFFDVFYEVTLAQPNKVYIDVFALGGYTPVVEVYDGCYGTLEACGVSTGISVITIVTPELSAGTYKIRVGSHSPAQFSGSDGDFLLSVTQLPFAGVQNNPGNPLYACDQGGFQLEDFVGATPQTSPGILDYEWLVAEEGGPALTEWQRGEPNYVARCEWLGMEYNKTYNVFVRVLVDLPFYGPVWGTYQGDYQNPHDIGSSACTISTASSVTPTEIRPNYTPTNALGDDYELCDFAIAYNVSGSENFRWRFDGNGTPDDSEDIIYTRGTGNPSVRLNWVNNLIPGLTYNVAVEVQVAGQWSGYSTVLPLTMALTPNDVTLRSPYCGGTYAPNGYILSESVCDADLYQFRFTPTGGGTSSYRNSGNYVCFLSGASPTLTPGDYDVQVKVTQNGVPGDWGPACTITISGPQGPGSETPILRDLQSTSTATLFPNPNSGADVRVNLDGLSEGNHEVMIQIYNIYGKLISTEGFGHEGERLSRLVRFDGEMAMGVYMVQIVVDGETFATERMIVK